MHGESTDIAKIRVEPTTTPTINSPVVVATLNIEATGLSGKSSSDAVVSTRVEVIGSILRVHITSQNDLKVLMAKINAGVCYDVISRLTPDENKATLDAVMALWDKFPTVDPNTDTSPAFNAEVNDVSTINHLIHGWSYLSVATTESSLDPQAMTFKEAVGFVYATPNLACPLTSETMDTNLAVVKVATKYYARNNWAKYGLTRLMMNDKGFLFFKFDSNKGLEDVLENGPWMIRNSPIILKKWTTNTSLFKEELTHIQVCIKIHDMPLQGRSSFSCCLIEVKADKVLKESITMGIPMLEGTGFSKETVCVQYEWKPPRCDQCKIFGHVYDQCPKNAITTPTADLTNDGFQTVVNKTKKNEAPSPPNDDPYRNGVLKVSTSKVDFDPETYIRSGEDVDSDEEVEVVYDEFANLLKSTKTRASTSTSSDFLNT
ncbi:zinc knuckle CX2CX4HX4C containing protein [Tanacetum coccineum]